MKKASKRCKYLNVLYYSKVISEEVLLKRYCFHRVMSGWVQGIDI